MDDCATDDPQGIEIWTRIDENGEKRYAFGCEGDFLGLRSVYQDESNENEVDVEDCDCGCDDDDDADYDCAASGSSHGW